MLSIEMTLGVRHEGGVTVVAAGVVTGRTGAARRFVIRHAAPGEAGLSFREALGRRRLRGDAAFTASEGPSGRLLPRVLVGELVRRYIGLARDPRPAAAAPATGATGTDSL
jgi:hypothetical protein